MISLKDRQAFDELPVSTCIEQSVPVLMLLRESDGDHESDPENLVIRCSLVVDDEGSNEDIVTKCNDEKDACTNLVFSFDSIDFYMVPVNNEDKLSIKLFAKSRLPDVEWRNIVQLRIHACGDTERWNVVDADVFEFGNRVPPLLIYVNDYNIAKIKISIRYIVKMFNSLPEFTEGDLLVKFSDEVSGTKPIKTYKSLLQMHSSVLSDAISKSTLKKDGLLVIVINCCNEHCFRELLYQIYPTQRPVYADFRALCSAAVSLKVNLVLEKLVNHLVNYDHMGFKAKIEHAAKLGLNEALYKLIYDCAKSGKWSCMINAGFDPRAVFPSDIYFKIICPAFAKALLDPSPYPYQTKHSVNLDFENHSLADNSSIAHLKVQGKSFYVNQGILKIYNDSMFARGNKGEYYVNMTLKLRNVLEESQLEIVDIIKPLLLNICGQEEMVQAKFIRPLIVFAEVHQMPYLKLSMENLLIMEPPITPKKLLDHLRWAQNYDLKNLLRTTLFRIEGGYREIALGLLQLPTFNELVNVDLRERVQDRLCSGWAAFGNNRLSKIIPTQIRTRQITSSVGGAVVPINEDELRTLIEADHAIYEKGENLKFL